MARTKVHALECGSGDGCVFHGHGLCDLACQLASRYVVVAQRILDLFHQRLLAKLEARDVEGNAHARAPQAPLLGVAAFFLVDPGAGPCDQAVALGQRQENRWADHAPLWVLPMQQGLGRRDLRAAGIDLGLEVQLQLLPGQHLA